MHLQFCTKGYCLLSALRACTQRNRSSKYRLSILSFLFTAILAGTIQNSYAQDSDSAKKLIPIIMMLLEDESVFLEIGRINPETLEIQAPENSISATFGRANDALNLSFTVSGLQAGQTLIVTINGRQVGQVSSNGSHEFLITNSFLSATSSNSLEFTSNGPNDGVIIQGITLLNAEGPHTRAEAVRFLTKATFGANETSINRLLELGYEAWLDEQLLEIATLHNPFYTQNILEREAVGIIGGNTTATQKCSSKMDTWFHGAMNGEDQVRQRMAYALSQIFVVGDFACDSFADRFPIFYDVLVDGSFGNYRDLLENVTLNASMGQWLSLVGSRALSETSSPDENYARELMQLFSIGVFELNLDGSLKLQNGLPIDTYDDDIVHDTARALTGWNQDQSLSFFPRQLVPLEPWGGLYSRFHDHGEKTILNGVVIPAGSLQNETGNTVVDDLKIVLDTIAAHDNVAPFISKQLIQRFVTSNPSPAYVQRVATVFNNNGAGIKGDLGAVIKAILLDADSINSHENAVSGGKLKEPLLRVTQIWRAFNAQPRIKYFRYLQVSRDFGQRPMGADSVFNFYRPDYAPLGEIADRGLVAPEFNLTGDALLLRTYPAMQDILDSLGISDNDIVSGEYTAAQIARPQLNLDRAKALSTSTSSLMNYFNELLFGGLMSSTLRNRVTQYLDQELIISNTLSDDEIRNLKVEEALFILGVSPEFNVQR